MSQKRKTQSKPAFDLAVQNAFADAVLASHSTCPYNHILEPFVSIVFRYASLSGAGIVDVQIYAT